MPNMYQAIDGMKKKVQSEFVKIKIDLASCLDANGSESKTLKTMETMQAKEELSIQLKNWNAHQLLDKTLFNTVWRQCYAGMKTQLNANKYFNHD